eukprot:TRINITY_DN4569_c0_g2_i3.p1 TRINITY_DN4569_c0_g2~~TRINITY_DN4569_c0_g2_i3.p1  ORF type:complete len:1100 (+),score=244.45 TRINITY_DN4569_c0_g2_i3:439-3300(+)
MTAHRLRIQRTAEIVSTSISNQVSHSLSVTYALAAMVLQRIEDEDEYADTTTMMMRMSLSSSLPDFDHTAQLLMRVYGGVNVLGIVSSNGSVLSYPSAIDIPTPVMANQLNGGDDDRPFAGYDDYFAQLVQTHNMIVIGPYQTNISQPIYDHSHITALYPVYRNDTDGESGIFWGFVLSDVFIPAMLRTTKLEQEMRDNRLLYWLQSTNPDRLAASSPADITLTTSSHVDTIEDVEGVIATNTRDRSPGDPVQVVVSVPGGGQWVLKVQPIEGWSTSGTLWVQILIVVFIALVISSAMFFLLRQPALLRKLAKERTLQLETARFQLEEKNRVLRRLDVMKDQFMANTSHELRTPLMGIIGLTETLIEDATELHLPQRATDTLKLVVQSGKRLAHLVDDILSFETMKNGNDQMKPRLKMQPFDLGPIVQNVLMVSSVPPNKPIRMFLNIPRPLPCVLADEQRIEQVLYNLVDNAIKYSEHGDIIVTLLAPVATPPRRMSSTTPSTQSTTSSSASSTPQTQQQQLMQQQQSQQSQGVTVQVSDMGTGISEDDLPRIFLDFERLDMDRVRGTGLGLPLAKMLLELHGSTIKADSVFGKGSTFSFDLPVAPKSKNPLLTQQQQQQQHTATQHASVLIGMTQVYPSAKVPTLPIREESPSVVSNAHTVIATTITTTTATKEQQLATTSSTSTTSLCNNYVTAAATQTTPDSMTPLPLLNTPSFPTPLIDLNPPTPPATPPTPIVTRANEDPTPSSSSSSSISSSSLISSSSSSSPPPTISRSGPSDQTTPVLQSSNPPSALPRILVIDDEEVNRKVFAHHLKGNFTITIAKEGFEGLEKLGLSPNSEGAPPPPSSSSQLASSHPDFDLVLLDVNMPKMDGYNVCKRIRQMYTPWQLPVLLITAQSQPNSVDAGYEAGANDFITKPITKEHLRRRIQFHLDQAAFTQQCYRYKMLSTSN